MIYLYNNGYDFAIFQECHILQAKVESSVANNISNLKMEIRNNENIYPI